MAPFRRGGRGRGASRGGSRGGKRPHTGSRSKNASHTTEPKKAFNASRVEDIEDEDLDAPEFLEDDPDSEESSNAEDGDDLSEDEPAATNSYATLLQSLNTTMRAAEPPKKKRKLQDEGQLDADTALRAADVVSVVTENVAGAELHEAVEEEENEPEEDSDDEAALLQDPFENHYSNIEEADLEQAIRQQEALQVKTSLSGTNVRKTTYSYGTRSTANTIKSAQDLKIKRRLADAATATFQDLSQVEKDVAGDIFAYRDLLCGIRLGRNSERLRDLSCLHALNHIFKTRDRVLKNNAKIAADTDGDGDFRDQGFTRPKVLIVLPTKQACVRFVDSIVKLSQPDQQENKGRFLDTFSRKDPDSFNNKPDDFRELFAGNHEEDFRAGLKFTRKTIKFFSGFYNSDIIFASALGLMRTITTGGGNSKDKKKGHHDADFLSSIEVAIVDHANAIEMQNWQHVDYIFSQLNQLPKESHGCDFARARNWYLDGKAQYLRQTIILSDYLTPSINSLASTHMHNIAGRTKYVPKYPGAMLQISPSIPMTVTQTFLRFDSLSPQTDSDFRFKFFTTTILPLLLRGNKANTRGTLLYVPTYLDFVRLRNHFSTASETTNLSFGALSEYSTVKETARARAHFANGRHSILLYTERAHHYFRYRIKGVRRVLCYGVPENPLFWPELVDLLGLNANIDLEWLQAQSGSKQGKGLVRALFSKWDVMKLERIVGTERVGRLVGEREGDTFDFV